MCLGDCSHCSIRCNSILSLSPPSKISPIKGVHHKVQACVSYRCLFISTSHRENFAFESQSTDFVMCAHLFWLHKIVIVDLAQLARCAKYLAVYVPSVLIHEVFTGGSGTVPPITLSRTFLGCEVEWSSPYFTFLR